MSAIKLRILGKIRKPETHLIILKTNIFSKIFLALDYFVNHGSRKLCDHGNNLNQDFIK